MTDNRGETASGKADPGSDLAAGPAGFPGALQAVPEDAVVRRTRDGWRVGGADVPDLTCAMVLADLLAAELAAEQAGSPPADGQSPAASAASPVSSATQAPAGAAASAGSGGAAGPAGSADAAVSAGASASAGSADPADVAGATGAAASADAAAAAHASATPAPAGAPADGPGAAGPESAVAREASRLRATVSQLEHALTARVRVEQAIGVLAERHRILPRQAFEQLRSAARNRGRRVIDIAADVVASATNPLLQLPDELSRPRSSGRNRSRPPHSALETK
jgi:hypothetical protein